jgi:XTP/dITP diphosphohydrolase
MDQLLFATFNPGKLSEVRHILADVVRVVSPAELSEVVLGDVEETGSTFAENALLKAQAALLEAKMPALADDSGLEVEALQGAPGVHSKRFISGSDHDRNAHLLKLMENHTNRRARFVTVLCLATPQETLYFEGELQGTISLECRGTAGFGYDSLFIPDGFDQTLGELGSEVKNRISHRSKALEKVKKYLKEQAIV